MTSPSLNNSISSKRDSKRPTIVLLISAGWSVRNYLRSEFLSLIKPEADVVVLIAPGDEELGGELREQGIRVETLIPCHLPHRFTSLNGFLNAAFNRRVGFWNPYLWELVVNRDSPFKRPYFIFQRAASKLLSHSPFYELLLKVNEGLLSNLKLGNLYASLFDELQPDLVISTNPYSTEEMPVIRLAKEREVQTVGAIVSWDNLSYKGPMPVEHDRYIVWSRRMSDELRMHKPEFDDEQINITGTPQFDFHLRPDLLWSREEFFAQIGGDPRRKLITYGGSVNGIFGDEAEFIKKLWRAIEDGAIEGHPQLLIRLHPHDNLNRFQELKAVCPGILISKPWPYDAQRFWWFAPELKHLALLSNTIRYSDVGLNVASSLTLDFAILDKPVINITFPGIEGNPLSRHVRYTCISHHYKQVIEIGAVRVADNAQIMIEEINRYLRDPSLEQAERARLVNEICGPVDGKTCQRIAALVTSLVQEDAGDKEDDLSFVDSDTKQRLLLSNAMCKF